MLDSSEALFVSSDGCENDAVLTVRENIDGGPNAMYMIEVQQPDGEEVGAFMFSKGQLAQLAAQILEVLP